MKGAQSSITSDRDSSSPTRSRSNRANRGNNRNHNVNHEDQTQSRPITRSPIQAHRDDNLTTSIGTAANQHQFSLSDLLTDEVLTDSSTSSISSVNEDQTQSRPIIRAISTTADDRQAYSLYDFLTSEELTDSSSTNTIPTLSPIIDLPSLNYSTYSNKQAEENSVNSPITRSTSPNRNPYPNSNRSNPNPNLNSKTSNPNPNLNWIRSNPCPNPNSSKESNHEPTPSPSTSPNRSRSRNFKPTPDCRLNPNSNTDSNYLHVPRLNSYPNFYNPSDLSPNWPFLAAANQYSISGYPLYYPAVEQYLSLRNRRPTNSAASQTSSTSDSPINGSDAATSTLRTLQPSRSWRITQRRLIFVILLAITFALAMMLIILYAKLYNYKQENQH